MRPQDIVRKNRVWDSNRMDRFEINGKLVKTNFGAYNYPYWNGNGAGYRRISFRKSYGEIFDELVASGYTYIRFVETTTAIRGYHDGHYMADKRIIK